MSATSVTPLCAIRFATILKLVFLSRESDNARQIDNRLGVPKREVTSLRPARPYCVFNTLMVQWLGRTYTQLIVRSSGYS